MKKNILAVCDSDEEYAVHLMEYLSMLRMNESFPFEVQVFTNPTVLRDYMEHTPVQLLLVSESIFGLLYDETGSMQPPTMAGSSPGAAGIIVLRENGEPPPGTESIFKYQSAEMIVSQLMELAVDRGVLSPVLYNGNSSTVKLIGIYTPVGRCLQTTFAFTLGQLLARKHKVLYLNFENFSGLGRLLDREFRSDLSDLIYMLSNDSGRFPYRVETMAEKLNGLDFIPPAFSCMDLMQIEKEEWLRLLSELTQRCRYKYVILDLSDSMQGLFDILQRCSRVYTIVREDWFAAAKIQQYEDLLVRLDETGIMDRTRKCRLPLFRQLPSGLDHLTHGELADYVNGILKEDWGDDVWAPTAELRKR